jgi:hypothetical protein
MVTALIVYTACASAVLIWSTLPQYPHSNAPPQASKGRIEYVVIPHSFLGGWAQSYPNLVIFDLQARAPGDESLENIAGWLPVSASELPGLLKWLPPESRVVFSAAGAIRRLDSEIEDVLLQSNIETVFFCEETATCPLPISFGKGTTTRSRNT